MFESFLGAGGSIIVHTLKKYIYKPLINKVEVIQQSKWELFYMALQRE